MTSFSSALLSLFSTRRKRRSTSNGCASKSHLGLCYKAILLAELTPPPAVLQLGIEEARHCARQQWRVRYGGRPLSPRIELRQGALEAICAHRQGSRSPAIAGRIAEELGAHGG